MAPNRGRNRAHEFEALIDNSARDFDPEEDHVSDEDGEDINSSSADEEQDGREHYIDVGKSKLRTPKAVALGPQYRGSRVSRDAIEEEGDQDEDGLFDRGFDEEDSEEGDEGDGEALDNGESVSDLEDLEYSEGPDEDETSDTGFSEEELHDPVPRQAKQGESVKEQLRKGLNGETQRAVTASLSQANKEEADKGRAVKRQRAAFDSLLNMRMKLQKSLIATNTLAGLSEEQTHETHIDRDEASKVLDAAETAAFNLWSSLNSLREDLAAARTGQKRKRAYFSPDARVEDLFAHVEGQEAASRPLRDAVLRKWSTRSQGPTVLPARSRLNQSESRATIIDVLQEQLLSSSERLVQRTHAPRSCAPLQLSQRVAEDERIYDDADFYGLLLKELLEQKSQDSAAAAASNIDLGFQMRREARTKRNVDTKASKGRKLRYTVHEKLQNFMAPEDRSSWAERQADDLFGSLFGQKLGLGEDEHDLASSVEGTDIEEGVGPEEAGLMMFRT